MSTFCYDESSHEDLLSSQAGTLSTPTLIFILLLISEIQGCGFFSREETGIITSQNWPMNYKANAECMWNIALPLGKKITLTFTHFDLEAKDILTSKCFDNVMVYEINSLTNALIQKYGKLVCGTRTALTDLKTLWIFPFSS